MCPLPYDRCRSRPLRTQTITRIAPALPISSTNPTSPLARLELRVMFEELLPRLSDTRRTAEPRYVRSNLVNGLKELAVEVTLA
ncbi:Cytochrome P450-terp [Streptomyces rimosus subsp. rimosus]|uniref:Cytochrome P450-terp n=1 Tax=Streptomyces rimosus subsp. rimosus TaxID=132474 RepID=A0ABY3YT53_STRRM|nr:Cytochrome P450-terp [Streptomyces rimosus subsp. rimosus]UTH92826.1 Cytochrome P450-terp [Streptomyces rimosus subsp. rimosus]UTH99931.1 Cytochrome P450-terp [Streptomyces rimosus subsp. rimosus]UTJ10942.1 Cytochrome P450-terp [Streptomyces rimosus subsp. rimosus]UTJ18027.1 Cytochrome P450-terp [Streptomyces rimosus subsp. rimosus]